MVLAVEHIRRMRGGAQSHLMRCDDGGYYVVKFQNNPQHLRILANEMLGTRLAARLGLPVPRTEVVEVRRELIELTADLVMQLGMGRTPCRAGQAVRLALSGRSGAPDGATIFCPTSSCARWRTWRISRACWSSTNGPATPTAGRRCFFVEPGRSRYQAMMIDQGFCFNAGEWNFPDAPLRGLYARHRVYEQVTGMDSFEPWLGRVEQRMSKAALGEIADEIPPEWYNDEYEQLGRAARPARPSGGSGCAS